ncbi:helicase [Dictyobacter sp. S3.2.2.5]|uniref:Helicase n=1 Tax=Dictyobacter halimunensis TaxID=3026934 RepID=A0ABQ6G1Z6_9CHLR|nr:helicase [Dictyobacter sp. S3.2.2.5]
MTLSADDIIELARKLRESFAGTNLPPSFAKLYSQYTRLRANQPGLSSWQREEATERLNDAISLLEAAFIERDAGDEHWRDSVRRAGALLEWLSHPQIQLDELPLNLLAAASYQLAGYPALSSGLLGKEPINSNQSLILYFLLKADFPLLLEQIIHYWEQHLISSEQGHLPWEDASQLSLKLQQRFVKETISALGVLYAEMRWGENARLQNALKKISAMGNLLTNGDDSYSWLLAKLCSEVASVYVNNSLRSHIKTLLPEINETGQKALERYLHQCFQQSKMLAWPSQIVGIKRLSGNESFVLCTPTGSGKTRVAELAILKSLFLNTPSNTEDFFINKPAPLALYLVPSRALAAEVEANLSRVLRNLNEPPISITGLYGGTDWGPTDAWLTSDVQTVLICTYEKAEALMRFLGSILLKRLSLVVIDEAHSIQFNDTMMDLRKAESRSLRLESLGTRLFTYLSQSNGRVIALSAVTAKMQNILANWVTGKIDAEPAETLYRSTRQLIGRLEVHSDKTFSIHYDLLDGENLQFKEGHSSETPFIINPFDSCPSIAAWESTNRGPEKRLRPYSLWAAMQFAAQYHQDQRGAVLISVTQNINSYAQDFLTLLESTWVNEKIQPFFLPPQEESKVEIWQKCLRSCEDYFGKESHEYKLLEKGIVVHHGKMPGLMARSLVQAIQTDIVHIVLATSTLSEGVNLPFETVLVPTILRSGKIMDAREFTNLVGRAGRPGVSTEGRTLVVLENERGHDAWEIFDIAKIRDRYENLIEQIKGSIESTDKETGAISPLAQLLQYLKEQWDQYFAYNNQVQFFEWLEKVTPLHTPKNLDENTGLSAVEAVDTLDSILLSVITEFEQIENEPLVASELENRLRQIWQRSYAYYAAHEERILEEIFIRRGKSIETTIYPDAAQRRRLYRTSLPPRSGNELLELYPKVEEELKKGEEYSLWWKEKDKNRCFNYIQTIVDLLGTLSKFELKNATFGNTEAPWEDILRWWLDPNAGIGPKTPSDISRWYDYVYHNFLYKFNWGLGSIISLAWDEIHKGITLESSLQDWPLLQLPWIVFWMKELITWGTLDPVAAYLLAKNIKITRKDAEEAAEEYYNNPPHADPNEILNASFIRNWADNHFKTSRSIGSNKPPAYIQVELLRNFERVPTKIWKVIPVIVENKIQWLDPAGFPLASCWKPKRWESYYSYNFDFTLNASEAVVSSNPYL